MSDIFYSRNIKLTQDKRNQITKNWMVMDYAIEYISSTRRKEDELQQINFVRLKK